MLPPEVWYGLIATLESHANTGRYELKETKCIYYLYFIIAHYVGTDTLSVIQANTTRSSIRLGDFVFKWNFTVR